MSLYLISDLHFDDKWICDEHRPFSNPKDMNNTLLKNCKSKIDEDDTLLFLGDIVGKNGTEEDVWEWFGKLGEIDCWVPGDHDHVPRSEYDKTALPVRAPFLEECKGHSFRFKHKQYRKKEGDNWIIHGHKHNEKPDEYPFIDPETRRVNISSSMVGYEPITMERIIELIETGQRYRIAPRKE
jgi:calcineurin-like phosphoesterase family protein